MNHALIPHVLIPPPTNRVLASDCTNDCDCACALDSLPVWTESAALWQRNPALRPIPLTEKEGWQAAYNPRGPLPLAVLNLAAWDILNAYAAPRPLEGESPAERTAIQQLAQAGFLLPLDTAPVVQPPSLLTAWLHLTDSCNLRCDYCYLPHHPQTMPRETAFQAIKTLVDLAQSHQYPALKLKYAGGEPLLRFTLLQEIHAHATQSAQQAGLRLETVLLTNGTLLNHEHLAYLRENHIRLMISLDGIGKWHDVQRHYAGGKPSFAQVEQAIERARNASLSPHISITLSEKNLPGLPETVSWLLERSLTFSLNFYRENDCASAIRALDARSPHTRTLLEETFSRLEANPPRHSLLGMLADRASFSSSHLYPCGAGRDYLVIRPDGRIAKCQMEMHIPVTSLQAADPLAELRHSPNGLQNPSVLQKPDCVTCDWRSYCVGGCPLLAKRVSGSYETRSPYCELYRFLFPRLLRLEAIRLIKTSKS
ncbi:MAG: radical SAM protein [Anaerolineales bacterium]|nr:radical SAM protein [Anaerolineales bacterium]